MLNKDELQDLFFIQLQLTDLLLNDSGLRTFAEVLNKNQGTEYQVIRRFICLP